MSTPAPKAKAAAEDIDAELRVIETSLGEDTRGAGGVATVDGQPRGDTAIGAEPGTGERPVTDRSAPGAVGAAEPAVRRWRRLDRGDAIAIASLVAMAIWVIWPLWFHLDHELREDPQDQAFFEWMMAHGARVVTEGAHPFLSSRMNVPLAVNLMANTSVLSVSVPLTPITLIFGPHVSFNVFLTLAMVVTGVSWYLVLSRYLVKSRVAAWLGALFAGFAPSMISHAGGHPNIVSQFLVPVIILRTLRLREPGRSVRNGLLLAFFVVWQGFINLEVLLMTAVGLGIFTVVMAIARPTVRRSAAPFLKALGVTAVAAFAVLAYPLYIQLRGPYSYDGLSPVIRGYGADLASFVAYSRRSIAGNEELAKTLAQNAAEENAFFGWGLIILLFALVFWLRRNVVVVALGGIALFFAVLSLGPKVYLSGENTGVSSLWQVLQHLPILHSAVPTRWALAVAPVVAILLAFGMDRVRELERNHPTARRGIRFATVTVLAMALLPLTPTPLPMRPMDPVPQFVTSGEWRKYVDEQHSLVTLPLPDSTYTSPLRWSAYTKHEMRIPRGYFLGPQKDPNRPEDRTALFTAPWRSTSAYFYKIATRRPVNPVDNIRRKITLDDLRYWKAGAVVMAPQPRGYQLREAMTQILGFEPTFNKGVWMWDVQALVDDKSAKLIGPEPAPTIR